MNLSKRVWNITDQLIRLNKTNLNKYITLSNDKAITIFEGFTSTSLDKEITLNFAQSTRTTYNQSLHECTSQIWQRGKLNHFV